MNFHWKKEPDPPPLLPLDDGCKMDAAGLLGQHFFLKKIQNGGRRFTLDWLECLRWRIFTTLILIFGFDWGLCYLGTLVMLQNCTKMLRNLTFVVQFAYFCIKLSKGGEQQKIFCFLEIFEQLSLQKATFDFFEQHFEKLRATFWEISSNLWKALLMVLHGWEPTAPYAAIVTRPDITQAVVVVSNFCEILQKGIPQNKSLDNWKELYILVWDTKNVLVETWLVTQMQIRHLC